MRLFVAIPLPTVAHAKVRQFQLAHASAFPNYRWVAPHLLHVTLKFLGDADEPTAAAARKAVGSVSTGEPLALQFGTLRLLGPRSAPDVLAMELKGEVDGIEILATRLEQAFVRLGFEPEPRTFLPHVTIGRLRGIATAPIGTASMATVPIATAPMAKAPILAPPKGWFTVSSVRLMKSVLGGPEPVYETLLDVPMIDSLTL